jgi:Tfp pilus assembly protein PilX
MMKMKLLKKGESGEALILALILLVISSLIAVPTLSLASTSLRYHQVVEKKTKEMYAADSGIQYALRQLIEEPVPFGPESLPSDVNGKTVTVTVENMGSSVLKITATAVTAGSNSSTTISSYVSIASLFDYGITTLDGDISLSGNSEVTSLEVLDGDIYANGNIYASGNSEVNGDAVSTGTIDVSGNAEILGMAIEQAAPITFPVIDTSVYLDEAEQGTLISGNLSISNNGYHDLGPAHITGNLTISGNAIVRLTGTVWVDGTISMSGNTRIEGGATIVASGNITVTGNTKLDPDNIPFVISNEGNITVTGNSWTSVALYAPNGHITMTGNSKVYGCVIGESVDASGNSMVQYLDLNGHGDIPAGQLNMLTYNIS